MVAFGVAGYFVRQVSQTKVYLKHAMLLQVGNPMVNPNSRGPNNVDG